MPLNNLIDILDIVITNGNGLNLSVKNLFTHVTLYDGLFANSTSGEISIRDSARLQEMGALFGDELLTITYRDIPNKAVIERRFIMFSCGKKIPNKNQRGTFSTYGLMSAEAFYSATILLRKTYRGTAFDIISSIWEDSDLSSTSSKKFNLKEGDLPKTVFTFCATGWTPFFTINWLVSKLTDNGQSDWMFYELPGAINGSEKRGTFEIQSISNLVVKKPEHVYSFITPNTTSSEGVQYISAAHFDVDPWDSLLNTQVGVYASTAISHDITQKRWERRNYSYAEEFDKSKHTDENSFVNASSGEKYTTKYSVLQTLVSDDRRQFTYSIPESDNKFSPHDDSDEVPKAEVVMHRTSQLRQIHYGQKINLALHGNSSIQSGQTLNFAAPGSTVGQETDIYLSGTYIVTSVAHTFTATDFQTNITIAKNALGSALPGGTADIKANEGPRRSRPDPAPGRPIAESAWSTFSSNVSSIIGSIPGLNSKGGT